MRTLDIRKDISLGGQRGTEPTITMRWREFRRVEDTSIASGRGEAALMECSGLVVRGKIYAVARGRQIVFFDTWEEVKPLVEGVSDALHRSFHTMEDAKGVA